MTFLLCRPKRISKNCLVILLLYCMSRFLLGEQVNDIWGLWSPKYLRWTLRIVVWKSWNAAMRSRYKRVTDSSFSGDYGAGRFGWAQLSVSSCPGGVVQGVWFRGEGGGGAVSHRVFFPATLPGDTKLTEVSVCSRMNFLSSFLFCFDTPPQSPTLFAYYFRVRHWFCHHDLQWRYSLASNACAVKGLTSCLDSPGCLASTLGDRMWGAVYMFSMSISASFPAALLIALFSCFNSCGFQEHTHPPFIRETSA